MTNCEQAIALLTKIVYERRGGEGSTPTTLYGPTRPDALQVCFDIRYNDLKFGSRLEKIVLFSDGTWRWVSP